MKTGAILKMKCISTGIRKRHMKLVEACWLIAGATGILPSVQAGNIGEALGASVNPVAVHFWQRRQYHGATVQYP
jgi:hypothetical protein